MAEVRTSWQDSATVSKYLDERRAALPFGTEMLAVVDQILGRFLTEVTSFADLGAGDGFFARLVLNRYPKARAILVDHSTPMLDRARANLADLGDQVTYLQADLGNALTDIVPVRSLDLVISRFAIHHLPDARKQSIYAETYAILRPGGLFVHNEHVASATPELEALSDTLFIDRISERTGRPRVEVETEFFTRPDRLDNKLAPIDLQLEWLRKLGFAQVDCYFKWLELVVFGGQKPL